MSSVTAVLPPSIVANSVSESLELPAETQQEPRVIQKKVYRVLTAEVVEEIQAAFQKIEEGNLKYKEAAQQCQISLDTFRLVVNRLKRGENPIRKNVGREMMTEANREKLESQIQKVKEKELSYEEAAEQLQMSKQTLARVASKIQQGKDPLETKARQGTTQELLDKIKILIPQIKAEKLTNKQAAEQCSLSLTHFRLLVRRIENGKDTATRKPSQKVTKEMVEDIRDLLPEIKSGKLSKTQLAEELNVSAQTLRVAIKQIEAGKDPSESHPIQKVTEKIQKTLESLLPQLDAKKLTYEQIAELCGLTITTCQDAVKKIKKGLNPTDSKPHKKGTKAIREKVESLRPKIKDGTLSLAKGAELCEISEAYFRKITKAIDDGAESTQPKEKSAAVKADAIRQKVFELLPKLKTNDITKKDIARKCRISQFRLNVLLKEFETNKEPIAS